MFKGAELEIVLFDDTDIITTSDYDDGPGDPDFGIFPFP